MHLLSQPFSAASIIVSICLILPTLALKRTIGPPGDARFKRSSDKCGATSVNNSTFLDRNVCPFLMACIWENFDDTLEASLQTGLNIAAFLPIVLVFIGELDLLSTGAGPLRDFLFCRNLR